MEQLERLDELSRYIRDCSLCGLGQTAPNPVLTTMRHFRQEFEDHIVSHRCVAGICAELALSPCENSCPLHMNIPALPRALQGGPDGRCLRVGDHGQSAALLDRSRLPASLRQALPAADGGRAGQHARGASLHRRSHSADRPLRRGGGARHRTQAGTYRSQDCRGRRRTGGANCCVLSGAAGTRCHGFRFAARGGRHAALRFAGISPAQTGLAPRDRTHRTAGREVHLQHPRRLRYSAQRSGRAVRRGLPGHRHLEGVVGVPAGDGAERRASRP